MGTYNLGGSATITVTQVKVTTGSLPPTIATLAGTSESSVTFGKPVAALPIASVTFSFRTEGTGANHMFGIKQLARVAFHTGIYAGNSSLEGSIEVFSEGSLSNTWFLDCGGAALNPLLDANQIPTGTQIFASYSPFFDSGAGIVRPHSDIEMAVSDHPGGNFRTILRNPATDRLNYLIKCSIKSEFLTALVAVLPGGKHVPIEAARWVSEGQAFVTWAGSRPSLTHQFNRAMFLGKIDNFTDARQNILLANAALTASDTIVQKFNNQLLAASGNYQRQTFTPPSHTLTRVGTSDVAYVQYPTYSWLTKDALGVNPLFNDGA